MRELLRQLVRLAVYLSPSSLLDQWHRIGALLRTTRGLVRPDCRSSAEMKADSDQGEGNAARTTSAEPSNGAR